MEAGGVMVVHVYCNTYGGVDSAPNCMYFADCSYSMHDY